jgi:hypothetical protein
MNLNPLKNELVVLQVRSPGDPKIVQRRNRVIKDQIWREVAARVWRPVFFQVNQRVVAQIQ